MKADEFVQELADLAPDVEDLVTRDGLSTSEANSIRKAYFCKKRVKRLCLARDDDTLGELLNGWDLGTVEVGMISFRKKPTKHQRGLYIGDVDADLLILSTSGSLVVEESSSPGHVLYEVARDGESFLKACLRAAQFLEEVAQASGETPGKPALDECVKAAGGPKYKEFYQMILGEY